MEAPASRPVAQRWLRAIQNRLGRPFYGFRTASEGRSTEIQNGLGRPFYGDSERPRKAVLRNEKRAVVADCPRVFQIDRDSGLVDESTLGWTCSRGELPVAERFRGANALLNSGGSHLVQNDEVLVNCTGFAAQR